MDLALLGEGDVQSWLAMARRLLQSRRIVRSVDVTLPTLDEEPPVEQFQLQRLSCGTSGPVRSMWTATSVAGQVHPFAQSAPASNSVACGKLRG